MISFRPDTRPAGSVLWPWHRDRKTVNLLEMFDVIVVCDQYLLRRGLDDGARGVVAGKCADRRPRRPLGHHKALDELGHRSFEQPHGHKTVDPLQNRPHRTRQMRPVCTELIGTHAAAPQADDHARPGRTGVDAVSPATVIHSRTYHRLTRPFTT